MIAVRLRDGADDVAGTWDRLFERAGRTIHQSRAYALAVQRSGADIWVVADHDLIAAFELRGDVARSLLGRVALLAPDEWRSERLVAACRFLANETGAAFVHFPEVHEDLTPRDLADEPELASWARRPSPYVDRAFGDEALWERVTERYGSRARRQRRRLEARGLTQTTFAGANAVAVLDQVERRSWKARASQSMHDRDRQFQRYAALLADPRVTLASLMDGCRPVAFRLDALVGRTLCCLKWSYDDEYRGCSPGFALLTYGLARDWDPDRIDRIDLFGGPDQLKALVATGAAPRIDLAWPAGPRAERSRAERQAHDARVESARQSGIGLRSLYLGSHAGTG